MSYKYRLKPTDQKRFNYLAVMEAQGTISAKEYVELEALSKERGKRIDSHPRVKPGIEKQRRLMRNTQRRVRRLLDKMKSAMKVKTYD